MTREEDERTRAWAEEEAKEKAEIARITAEASERPRREQRAEIARIAAKASERP